jgi:hypothetical protein
MAGPATDIRTAVSRFGGNATHLLIDRETRKQRPDKLSTHRFVALSAFRNYRPARTAGNRRPARVILMAPSRTGSTFEAEPGVSLLEHRRRGCGIVEASRPGQIGLGQSAFATPERPHVVSLPEITGVGLT